MNFNKVELKVLFIVAQRVGTATFDGLFLLFITILNFPLRLLLITPEAIGVTSPGVLLIQVAHAREHVLRGHHHHRGIRVVLLVVSSRMVTCFSFLEPYFYRRGLLLLRYD